jgi:hypothetical protein
VVKRLKLHIKYSVRLNVKNPAGITLGVVALAVYILGGLGVFSGIWLIVFMKGRNLWGWGEGHTIGYLFLCIGAALSILGVMLMRVFRNRGLS